MGVTVVTNSFVVRTPLDQIHLHMIEFTPDIPEDATDQRLRAVNHKSIRDKIISSYGPYFFENKHLLCLRRKENENQFTNHDLSQTVTVKYLKSINLKDLTSEHIEQHEQIIHLMLNKVIRGSDLTRIGANYYERNESLFGGNSRFDVKERDCPDIRIWRGYSITCERKMGGIHMNVDSVHRVLHQQSVGEKMIEDMVVNNVVITVYNKRLYRISEIDWNLSIDDTFMKDGKKISYRDYFDSVYHEKCTRTEKGMLVHYPRRRKNSTAPEKIVLPPELCHETGMSKRLKSNFRLMKRIADTTRIPAKDRHNLRSKLVKRLQKAIGMENGYDPDPIEGSQKGKDGTMVSSSPSRENVVTSNVVTSDSQIPMILSQKAVKVDGRLLPEFKVSIADQNSKTRKVDPYTELQAGWNNARFVNKTIIKIKKWVVMGDDKRLVDQCLAQIRNVATQANLLKTYISPNPIRIIVPRERSKHSTANWRTSLETVIREEKPNMVLAILPDDRFGNPTAVYNLVKTVCCTEIPVLTQCITKRNVTNVKRANSVFKGCVKQMLTKMGNTPWRANFCVPDKSINLNTPTMICGMDVNHDMRRNCSTVSFVASYTADYTKYNAFVYHQAFGREVMIEGGVVIGEALKKFHQCNKTLPQNIIIYRDGVSTAQLTKIVLHEVRSYKERFSKIKVQGKPYAPKLAVVVTQKNVSARFVDN